MGLLVGSLIFLGVAVAYPTCAWLTLKIAWHCNKLAMLELYYLCSRSEGAQADELRRDVDDYLREYYGEDIFKFKNKSS